MATADKLDYLLETKNQIKEAIKGKGVGVEDTDSFRSYVSKIGQIESTGGNIEEYFVTNLSGTTASNVLNRLIKKIPFSLDTSNITSMNDMFANCQNLMQLDLSSFDTSKVTGMSSMFANCSKLEQLDLSNFDTSKVTSMGSLFNGCKSLTQLNLSSFDTSKITYMYGIFTDCSKLEQLDLSSFDTSNATDMTNLFLRCSRLTSILGIIDMVKVKNVANMFNSDAKIQEVRIKNLNCSGLNLSFCSNLSHNSLIYLINNLMASDTVKTITLGSTNLAKLTEEEIAIATEKNWTLS